MKHRALAVLSAAVLCISLSGCAISAVTLQIDIAQAKSDLSRAIEAYGIAKGIAEVAVAADPALLVPVTAIEAIIDPLIPLAQAMLADASADLTDVNNMLQKIQTQVIAVETTTAAQVKVVPNKTTAAK